MKNPEFLDHEMQMMKNKIDELQTKIKVLNNSNSSINEYNNKYNEIIEFLKSVAIMDSVALVNLRENILGVKEKIAKLLTVLNMDDLYQIKASQKTDRLEVKKDIESIVGLAQAYKHVEKIVGKASNNSLQKICEDEDFKDIQTLVLNFIESGDIDCAMILIGFIDVSKEKFQDESEINKKINDALHQIKSDILSHRKVLTCAADQLIAKIDLKNPAGLQKSVEDFTSKNMKLTIILNSIIIKKICDVGISNPKILLVVLELLYYNDKEVYVFIEEIRKQQQQNCVELLDSLYRNKLIKSPLRINQYKRNHQYISEKAISLYLMQKDIIRALIDNGHADSALAVVKRMYFESPVSDIDTFRSECKFFHSICEALMKHGEYEKVFDIVRDVGLESSDIRYEPFREEYPEDKDNLMRIRNKTLADIADSFIKNNKASQAICIADMITNPMGRDLTKGAAVKSLIKGSGLDPDRRLEQYLVDSLLEGKDFNVVLAFLAVELEKNKDVAMQVASIISDKPLQEKTIAHIQKVQKLE